MQNLSLLVVTCTLMPRLQRSFRLLKSVFWGVKGELVWPGRQVSSLAKLFVLKGLEEGEKCT